MNEKEKYPQDLEGYEYVTNALMEMINAYPGLDPDMNERMTFSTADNEEGLSVFPTAGSFIYDNHESIIGKVRQLCEYPFDVVYKAAGLSEEQKIEVKEWLDTLGKWLTKQPICLDGQEYKLQDWPDLTGGRKITSVERRSPAILLGMSEDKCENWVMSMTVRYRNEFYR